MTSYTAIPNGDVDQDSPITQPLMTALRDNPIAIAEQDASVPVELRLGFYFLGTINTTSGTTQTLSGLNLTQYKMLYVSADGVNTASSASVSIAGVVIGSGGVNVNPIDTFFFCDLTGSGKAGPAFDSHTLTTASTSISATIGSSSFTAGSIKIYGAR